LTLHLASSICIKLWTTSDYATALKPSVEEALLDRIP
jgi:hypothetical protein